MVVRQNCNVGTSVDAIIAVGHILQLVAYVNIGRYIVGRIACSNS